MTTPPWYVEKVMVYYNKLTGNVDQSPRVQEIWKMLKIPNTHFYFTKRLGNYVFTNNFF